MKIDRPQSAGFTLIELLVVIAIIAILATLLFSAIATAKAKSHSAVCKNNLRQISVAYTIAVEDNSGRFSIVPGFSPPGTDWYEMNDFWTTYWAYAAKGWICPDGPPQNIPADNFLYYGNVDQAWGWRRAYIIPPYGPEIRDSSYTLNSAFHPGAIEDYLVGNHRDPFTSSFRRESEVQTPSQTPVWGDGTTQKCVHLADSPPPLSFYENHLGFVIPRHGSRPRLNRKATISPTDKLPGAINLGFYDGHAEQVPLERLWQQHWHRDYVPPAKRPGL